MSSKCTVLVIDDEQAFRESLRDILEAQGYGVVLAADGEAGLEQIRQGHFSLVLMDIRMPRKDGLQVLQELTGLSRIPPIIMVTAHRLDDDAKQLVTERAVAIYTKPLDIAVVLEAIQGHACKPPDNGTK